MNVEQVTLAAQSPDPALRSIAARRLQLEAEAAEIDKLFDTLAAIGTRVNNARLAAEFSAPTGEGTGVMPKDEFVATLRKIFEHSGSPMRPGDIFLAFRDLYPGFAGGGADALRKRLHTLKDVFRGDAEGFWWPIDVPIPLLRKAGG